MGKVNFTSGQWLGIVTIVLGVLVGGSAQLTDMGFPIVAVKAITAASGLALAIVGGLNTMFNSQANQVKTVAAMPGVSAIQTNIQASDSLKALAASDEAVAAKVLEPKK